MVFSKSYPNNTNNSSNPKWEEIFLTESEEIEQEEKARIDNIFLLKECIDDAKQIFAAKNLKTFQSDIVRVAIALFEKQASHSIFYKEDKTKKKFQKQSLKNYQI